MKYAKGQDKKIAILGEAITEHKSAAAWYAKVIQVENEIWQKLTIMKAEMMKTSLNEVIEELIKCKKQSRQKS